MAESGTVGALKITLGLDTIDFTNGMKNVNNRLSALNAEFKAITSGAGKFDNSIRNLRARSDVLTRTLDTQKRKVEELKARYEESKAANGENADETLRAAAAYNRAVAAMNNVERRLNAVNQQITNQTDPWKRASKAVQDYSDKLGKFGEKTKDVGTKISAGVTAPIVGVGLAAGKMASDFDSANGLIQAKLGVTTERAAALGKVAEGVWKDNFGENISSVAADITVVSQNLGNIPDIQLKSASEAAYTLSQTFGADVSESTKTAAALMKNFGIDSTKAFDIITTGFQKGGDYSGELLDTLNEYSVQFASMGMSADQFLSILISGAQNGAFSLDKVGDAVKEFNIRAQDGSKTTSQGFKAIGLDAQKMGEAIAQGGDEGQKAFLATVSALAAMKDPMQQNIAGTNLFGTQWEDVRKKVIVSMSSATKSILSVDGATKKASDAISNNFGSQLQTMWRNVQDDFKPVGDDLLKISKDDLPKVASSVEKVTGAFANLSPETQKTVITAAGIAAAVGPVIVGLGSTASAISAVGKVAAPVIVAIGGEGLAGSLTALAGPVGIAVGVIGILATAGYALKKTLDDENKANLNLVESLISQQQSLSDLTNKYDALRNKNKLSNDELLRFRDIQTELKTAKSAEEIKSLTTEADHLREKSGLSNTEMTNMLNLNDQIIKLTPSVNQAFSSRGNAIIGNTGALDKENAKLRENIALELENQRIKAEANLTQNIQNYITALDQLNDKEKERDAAVQTANAIEQRVTNLKLQAQQLLNAGKDQEAQKIIDEIGKDSYLLSLQNGKVISIANEVTEKQKSVNTAQNEIIKTQQLYDKMINLQLAQVGINAQGSVGITQLNQAIQKTQARINQLNAAKQSQGGLNAAQQQELSNLQSALGKYQNTKSEVQKIQGEQQSVNQKIDQGTGKAGTMNTALGKGINKKVNINDNGQADNLNAKISKSQTKYVTIQAIVKGLSAAAKAALSGVGINGFAVGTKYAPGGPSFLAEDGRELTYFPNKNGLFLVNRPSLLNLPRGAKVIPNQQTEQILRNWNVPALANGGVTLSPGMVYAGEAGREILDFSGATTSPINQSSAPTNKDLINSILKLASRPIRFIINDREFAMATADAMTEIQNFNTDRKKVFSGR